jgi:hypothetical protein
LVASTAGESFDVPVSGPNWKLLFSSLGAVPVKNMICRALELVVSVAVGCTALAGAQQTAPTEFPEAEVMSHRIWPVKSIHTGNPPANFLLQGYVMLQVIVTPAGKVESADPIEGPKEFFSEAQALEMEREFEPFEKDGLPVTASIHDYVRILPPEQWAAKEVPFPAIKDWNSLHITLDRTGCLGSCPSYSVEIRGDGSVTFNGRDFVRMKGVQQETISKQAVADLLDEFRRADYFSLKDRYETSVTDIATYTTSIAFDGHKKQVVDYMGLRSGMPEAVVMVERSIDEAANSDQWVKETD